MAINPIIHMIGGAFQTTDNSPHTIITIPTTSTHAYYVRAVVAARDASSGESGAFEIAGAFENTSSVVLQVSTTAAYLSKQEASWAGLSFAVSAGNILVQVAGPGAGGPTIDWSAYAEIVENRV